MEQRDPAAPRGRSRRHGRRSTRATRRTATTRASSTQPTCTARGPFEGHPLTGPVRGPRRARPATCWWSTCWRWSRAPIRLDAHPPGPRAAARGGLPEAVPPDLGCRRTATRTRASGRAASPCPSAVSRGDGDRARRAGRAQHDAAAEERREHGHQAAHRRARRVYLPVWVEGALLSASATATAPRATARCASPPSRCRRTSRCGSGSAQGRAAPRAPVPDRRAPAGAAAPCTRRRPTVPTSSPPPSRPSAT